MNNYTEPQIKQQIRHRLQTEALVLDFQLNGGQRRSLFCTLNPELMPPQRSDSHPGPPHDELQVVWDLENSEWRAYRWERLTSVSTKKRTECPKTIVSN